MKAWRKPALTSLSVQSTSFGLTITDHVDDVIIYNGYNYFSFS